MSMFFTPSNIENAKRVLKNDPDNSTANKQARMQARLTLNTWVNWLHDFAAKNPRTGAARSVTMQAAALTSIINHSVDMDYPNR